MKGVKALVVQKPYESDIACILCHDTRMDLVEQYIRLRENK